MQRGEDNQGNKLSMRSWIGSPSRIFPIVVDVVKRSFPRSKIHENHAKKRIHFWYLDSEQGDALIMMDITDRDSTSILNLYQPQYGVNQPLFIKDPIPLRHFFERLDERIRALGIPVATMRGEVK